MAGRLYGHEAIELSMLGLVQARGREVAALVRDVKGLVHPYLTPTVDAIEARLLVAAARGELRLIEGRQVELGERGPERLRSLLMTSLRDATPDTLALWESLKLALLPGLPQRERRAVADDILANRSCCLDAEARALGDCDPACPLSRECRAHQLALAEIAFIGLRSRVSAVLAAG